jgi:hypothetical protein
MDTANCIPDIEHALRALGDLLAADGQRIGVVLLGGAALNLLGVIERVTRDVDVLALAHGGRESRLTRPDPLPPFLTAAAARVRPTDADLRAAAAWVRTQDPSPAVATAVEKVVAYVRGARG